MSTSSLRPVTSLLLVASAVFLQSSAARATGAASSRSAVSTGYPRDLHVRSNAPHPAVARIVVEEGAATAYGSGTLVDVRDRFGLVITNWHVVRDCTGDVEVVFPDGFRSKARPLKVDADWDLAALVIWRPPIPPAPIAQRAPQPGDQLTICGYGQGQYRAATGRCTKYYAPKVDLPQHMVELDVEARQGDSGGPIFNDRGELAGVLFGAGGGTTLGSFGGRVHSFLTSLAPDIGRGPNEALVTSEMPTLSGEMGASVLALQADATHSANREYPSDDLSQPSPPRLASAWTDDRGDARAVDHAAWQSEDGDQMRMPQSAEPAESALGFNEFETAKSVLAVIGAIALLVQVLRVAR